MNVHGISFRSISTQCLSPSPVRDEFCSSGSVDTVTLSGNISQCSDAEIDRFESREDHRNADSLTARAEIAIADRQVSLRWQVRDILEAVCGKDGMIYTIGKDMFKCTDSKGNTGFQNILSIHRYTLRYLQRNQGQSFGDENGRIYVLTDDRRLIALDTDVRSVKQKISDSEKAIQDTKSEIIASDDWLIIDSIKLQINNERSGKAA